ncbi:MAG: hypothetical protein Q7T16_06745 [Candidatus Burarchaeum sp.]|nr:hypothetical protein [Candidatus Burarchaeum sp.]MDO8340326.1 hypothetical protein [Candidatus Burarchaeum sp.]
MHWRDALRYLLIPVSLYIFYDMGIKPATLAALGAIMLIFVALRGRIYGAVSAVLDETVPHTKKLPGWLKYAVTLAVFLLIFIVLKEIVYAALYYAGLDVKGEMFEAMNRSISG